jgi:hypothetical protein
LALLDKIRRIIDIKESPHAIALAFSVGIFIGMSPLFGFHTILGIILAWMFSLNKFVTIVGVYITNPWTIVPIYTFATWLGAKVLGIDQILPDINWSNIGFSELLHDFEPVLPSFALGTIMLGIVSSALAYLLLYAAIVRHRKMDKGK